MPLCSLAGGHCQKERNIYGFCEPCFFSFDISLNQDSAPAGLVGTALASYKRKGLFKVTYLEMNARAGIGTLVFLRLAASLPKGESSSEMVGDAYYS
jgi:hypothetical protein